MTRPAARLSYDKIAERVGEILHYVWDPIGVTGVPQARDEYDSYVPLVVKMLIDGRKKEEIAEHLSGIEGGHMGLTVSAKSREHAVKVAEALIDHYDWIKERGRTLSVLLRRSAQRDAG